MLRARQSTSPRPNAFLPQAETVAAEVENFLAENAVDQGAAESLRRAAPDVQERAARRALHPGSVSTFKRFH